MHFDVSAYPNVDLLVVQPGTQCYVQLLRTVGIRIVVESCLQD